MKRIITVLLSSMLFGAVVNSAAMKTGKDTEPLKTISTWKSIRGFSNDYFFKGWLPTVVLLAGGTIQCVVKDRQFPAKAFEGMKYAYDSTPGFVKFPAILLGSCWMYSYYKPRVNDLVYKLKRKMNW